MSIEKQIDAHLKAEVECYDENRCHGDNCDFCNDKMRAEFSLQEMTESLEGIEGSFQDELKGNVALEVYGKDIEQITQLVKAIKWKINKINIA